MKKVELYIAQQAKDNEVKTRLVVDGNRIDSKDNRLTNLVVYQPMHKWLNSYKKKLFVWDGLLAEIIEEFNDKAIHFVFCGCKADFTMFKKCILLQQAKLNRNGGAVDVAFEFADIWNPRKTIKEMKDILYDLHVEADNWGENDIIREIDLLKNRIDACAVTVNTDYLASSNEFICRLQEHKLTLSDESELTVIPVDDRASPSGLRHLLTSFSKKKAEDKIYLIVNTSEKENEALFDAVVSLSGSGDTGIKYIENDGENYISEIVKMYYYSALSAAKKKTVEILHRFPDYDSNTFLIDISDRIDGLFCINFR